MDSMGHLYRIYTLDHDGRIDGRPVEVECNDDDDAVARARQVKDDKPREVWHLDRRVAEIK